MALSEINIFAYLFALILGLADHFWLVDEVRTRDFQNTRPQELPASPSQQYDGSIGWLILILQPLQTFVELARCQRVMTTRVEFSFQFGFIFSLSRPAVPWQGIPVPPDQFWMLFYYDIRRGPTMYIVLVN